jgi:inorganic pyrophosphatase
MRDEKGVDDKVICVPLRDPNWNEFNELEDLPKPLRNEILYFFSIYKQPEGKQVEIDGWYGVDVALDVIEQARQRYASERQGDG